MVHEEMLTDDERRRNQLGDAIVYTRDESADHNIAALNDRPNFGAIEGCQVRERKYDESDWKDAHLAATAVFRPELLPGTVIPHPGFPTLKDAPVHGLTRRKLGINIFGMRSRYRTAVLELDREIPMITSAEAIAGKFIGTSLYFRYPFLQEGFVTAVSDAKVTVRGKTPARRWSLKESQTWKLKNDTIKRQYETGEGLTGSGGWNIPDSEVTLSIRPLKEIETLPDGSKVKVYARLEMEVPIVAAIWSPSKPDPRFINIPAKLEKNPYRFGSHPSQLSVNLKKSRGKSNSTASKRSLKNGRITSRNKILPDSSSTDLPKNDILPQNRVLPSSSSLKNSMLTSSNNFGTIARPSLDSLAKNKRGIATWSKPASSAMFRQIGRRRFHSKGALGIATVAAAFLSTVTNADTSVLPVLTPGIHNKEWPSVRCRGGTSETSSIFTGGQDNNDLHSSAPPLEFAHGTTTLAFIYEDGIVAAVDSRASIGEFVGSKTVNKVLPINTKMLGTMAGGAADCTYWIRKAQAESRHYELAEGKPITVARVSRLLADYLYANKSLNLSVGTMIMGYDESGPCIYYVDNKGTRIEGNHFSVGSGSTFALGILDSAHYHQKCEHMKEGEAIALGIKAIRHATFRDAFSGGYIAVYVIKRDGWIKVFSEDLALEDATL